MDIDNQNQRTKYAGAPHHNQHSQQHHYHATPGSSSSSKPAYESRGSRSNRGTRDDQIENEGQNPQHRSGRSSSGRHSSRGSSSRSSSRYNSHQQQQSAAGGSSYHHPSSTSQYHQSSRQGPTNAPPSSMISPNTNQHFTPPQSHFGGQQHRNSHHHVAPHTPDQSLQPTFPPPAVTSESPPPPEQSQRRPAYLLHRDLVIGKGSYGQVCIASRGEAEGHMSGSGRSGKRKKFACKCVMLRNDPKYISKLQEEVNVLRELRGHDNVIRLYDVFCVDNELFIITELGRGGDLFHLLTTHPKHGVTEAYAAKTVSEMLSAVAFLHSRSICHRDLKLENWVLESGKDVWSPLKLIDFGLSTHYRSGERLTRVVGSSYYVAPEVLKKSYTEACDLWSLGVIVYMLLSGAPPFYGKNDEAIKASIVQGEYTFPHELFRDVSDEAMAFVSTLLSYNIEYRYTAAQALTHPWLSSNCDQEALSRAKEGARGVGILMDGSSRAEPMQL
eukprot:CAMPEP_0201131828 /NCGR_PEP_ID=MMETSP0850-20130426/43972_1 /ASSEMBLY_ACC=CAM_ASM_000622 /TAXON_ID=183588 /ORGANISM="Pseudo-nitzschia fraudulenta, Strain WWA7" /LENGTH=499 /DNA_ID=CAMNT_0047401983 /DNA_START=539 /DNA_END=2038 /DNA_ORIENTATION=+